MFLEFLPARIQRKINANNLPFKVINIGLSGEPSAVELERVDLYIDQHFDLFVLELGANDILKDIPSEITQRNLQALIDKVKANYPSITMLFLGIKITFCLAEARTIPFNFVFKK
ncbi:lysophospholipase L1-like esterase [Pedobacter sp. CG_S7]|uniref:GDSL-type esterase/lipase family protein n=1 Tax=Pedobacter sp. CG_S7 TaxID=3143930 RepID=UPI00339652FE